MTRLITLLTLVTAYMLYVLYPTKRLHAEEKRTYRLKPAFARI